MTNKKSVKNEVLVKNAGVKNEGKKTSKKAVIDISKKPLIDLHKKPVIDLKKAVKNETPKVELTPEQIAFVDRQAQNFDTMQRVVKNHYRGGGVIFKQRNDIEQMRNSDGTASKRWYFFTSEKGVYYIVELKTVNKYYNGTEHKARHAYNYPVSLDENGKLTFEGGAYDSKEVSKQAQQAALLYILKQQRKASEKAAK